MPSFRSDNNASICPEALAAFAQLAREPHATGYGDDPSTSAAIASFGALFGESAEAFFVATGTAANCLAIGALTIGRPWSRVLCHAHAHYNDDESTAPELLTGCRTTTITPRTPAPHAHDIPASKLSPDDIARAADAASRADVHQPAPGALTISNPTEFGEVYTPDETRALADAAHARGYALHIDGARFANTVASLMSRDLSRDASRDGSRRSDEPGARATGLVSRELRERGLLSSPLVGEDVAQRQVRGRDIARALTISAGADALSFGGTKNGLALGEAILFFPQPGAPERFARAVEALPFLRKRAGHLLSKHRFLSAPFAAVLESGAWLTHAAHANAMAASLDAGLRALGFTLPFSTDTNAVFVRLSPEQEAALQSKGYGFYMFGDPAWRLARLMCSFDTSPEDVDSLTHDCRAIIGV